MGEVTVAALFVERGGVYWNLPGVDPWDETRDARKYDGPWPVVAHPPCERWGRYWSGGPSAKVRRALGDDGGCFADARCKVFYFGGVLEHPADSLAWRRFGIIAPPRSGGWVAAGDGRGWTCCVEQGHYGHRARKATWLYAAGVSCLPSLKWGPSIPVPSPNSTPQQPADGRRATRTGICQRMSRKQRRSTPPAFRDLLLSIARSATKGGERP